MPMPPKKMSINKPMLRIEVRSSHKNAANVGANSTPAIPRPTLQRLEPGTSRYRIKCVSDGIKISKYNINRTAWNIIYHPLYRKFLFNQELICSRIV